MPSTRYTTVYHTYAKHNKSLCQTPKAFLNARPYELILEELRNVHSQLKNQIKVQVLTKLV